jgi:integrase
MKARKLIWATAEGKKRMPELAAARGLDVKKDRQRLLQILVETKPKGSLAKEAYVVVYAVNGKRTQRTFDRKKDADAWIARTQIDVLNGTHTPDAASITVREAGERWLKAAARHLERATVDTYCQHLEFHILPYLGDLKLSRLTAAAVRDFEDKLARGVPSVGADNAEPRSPVMVKKVRGSLGAILADAQEQGLVARNVVRELRSGRRRGKERHAEKRQRGKLKAGVDFPIPDEVRKILAAAKGRWRSFFLVAVFCGLRASELRGLRWPDVDLKKGEVHVRQRADRYQVMGQPKSATSERTIPLPPAVTAELREWKLKCPKRPPEEEPLDLVFPNTEGSIEWHANIINRAWWPIQVAAGVTKRDGAAKYTGLHSLRHFFASWCLGRKVDGGRELPLKTVQELLGHSSITMTADVYGGLLPRGDDSAELAQAGKALLG